MPRPSHAPPPPPPRREDFEPVTLPMFNGRTLTFRPCDFEHDTSDRMLELGDSVHDGYYRRGVGRGFLKFTVTRGRVCSIELPAGAWPEGEWPDHFHIRPIPDPQEPPVAATSKYCCPNRCTDSSTCPAKPKPPVVRELTVAEFLDRPAEILGAISLTGEHVRLRRTSLGWECGGDVAEFVVVPAKEYQRVTQLEGDVRHALRG